MSEKLRQKKSDPQNQWRMELERAHWACVTGFELDQTVKRFSTYLAKLPEKVEIDESSRQTLLEIAPDLYDLEAELFTAGCVHLLDSPRNGLFFEN